MPRRPFCLVLLCTFVAVAVYPALGAYSGCAPLTIQPALVGGNLVNYTMTVSDTDPNLRSLANGGKAQNSNGFDIVFATDNSANNLLTWDAPTVWSPVTGQIVTRVLVPNVSGTSETVIYRCVGNSAVTSFQGGRAGSAYDSNTLGAWHFGSPTSLNLTDSGALGLNGVNHGVAPTFGPVYGGAQFDGTSSYLDMGYAGALNFGASNFTIEFWASPTAIGEQCAVCRGAYQADGWYAWMGAGKPGIGTEKPGITGAVFASSTSYTTGEWQHFAFVRTGASTVALYVNGALLALSGNSPVVPADSEKNLWFGQYSAGGFFFSGSMAEVAISTGARSAAWVLTDYNNQKNTAGFYRTGAFQLIVPATQVSITRTLIIQ